MQEKFLSMVKIKDPYNTVPRYLLERMSGIVDDGWFGDSPIGTECNAIACYYIIGDAPSLGIALIEYYFRFARSSSKSSSESPEAEPFQFTALIAHYEGKWYARSFSNSDFDHVKQTVHDHDQGAVELLKLEERSITNPLNYT